MQEKELRLALVCFGGVSLAIYIHGSTKEILKVVRASKAFHSDPDTSAESRKTYIYPNEDLKDVPDTELIYFEILKTLSPELDLRVIVDVIAGASAGGMNSIFLGRALAHDLSIDHLRHHWLEEADVSRLVGNTKPAGPLEKALSKPLVSFLSRKYLGNTALSALVREKLPALLNIWKLKPPFDGKHFLGLIYRGLDQMGPVKNHSLMPYGHRLDLYVTLTDYYGFSRSIPMNDPPIIHDREHRHKLHFSYQNKKNGQLSPDGHLTNNVKSDFDELDLPALSFAARATACFPGVFPPAQLREVDSFMKDLDKFWIKKEAFIKDNFCEYERAGLDPMLTSFLDGSILNNKPFDEAIKAIQGRPAFREVDRLIIYIDPNPEKMQIAPTGAPPSQLNTIRGALSTIPMNEPMHDDLTEIQGLNQQVNMIKTVIDNAKPEIEDLVAELVGNSLESVSDAHEIAYLRIYANIKSVTDSGFSYSGYARLKVRNTVANLTKLVGEICGCSAGSMKRRRIFTILQSLAFQDPFDFSNYPQQLEKHRQSSLVTWVKDLIRANEPVKPLPSWGYFLTQFDVNYQRRRLLFVIRDMNTYYAKCPQDARKLDKLKRTLYDILEAVGNCVALEVIPEEVKEAVRYAFLPVLEKDIDDNLRDDLLQEMLKDHKTGIKSALDKLADVLNLDQYKTQSDQLVADQTKIQWGADLAKGLAVSYIGFSFWDVTTYSIMGSKELGEFNEVRINRISPNDPSVLILEQGDMPLRGIAMAGFGAFFSRADRENDYLWGRLNSAERLIDLLYKQAKLSNLAHTLDLPSLKKRAFTSILATEEKFLHEIPEVFEDLKKKIQALP